MKQLAWVASVSIFFAASVCGAVSEPVQTAVEYKPPGWQPAPKNISEWADRCTDSTDLAQNRAIHGNISEWADRCTDSTVNGWGFKDPNNFPKLVELFSDPAIYLEFARRMQDPESYARVVGLFLDPGTVKNYLEWTDPVIYARWTQAALDPNFITEAMRPLTDVSTYMRWMALPLDQRAWSVGLNTMNPAMWLKWMTAGTNPKMLEPLAKAADPNTTVKWLQTGVNHTTYNPAPWFAAPAVSGPAGGQGSGARP